MNHYTNQPTELLPREVQYSMNIVEQNLQALATTRRTSDILIIVEKLQKQMIFLLESGISQEKLLPQILKINNAGFDAYQAHIYFHPLYREFTTDNMIERGLEEQDFARVLVILESLAETEPRPTLPMEIYMRILEDLVQLPVNEEIVEKPILASVLQYLGTYIKDWKDMPRFDAIVKTLFPSSKADNIKNRILEDRSKSA